MGIQKCYHKYERLLSDLAVCILIALCICLPAQSQIIKIPFLGVACGLGAIRLWLTRGKAISKATWIWFGVYLAYNLVWSVLGLVNGHLGAPNYFRLGVIWPVLFFFVTVCITTDTMKWIARVMIIALVIQTVCVYILIGNVFQLWPNILKPIYAESKVGLHPGYIHVVAHFIGGMAFTAPFVYTYFLLKKNIKPVLWMLLLLAWFVVVAAIVATSRRILPIVLLVCSAAALVIPFLHKSGRMRIFVRAIAGLCITGVFMAAATGLVIYASTSFLSNNYDAVRKVIQGRPEEQTTIRYIDDIVYNLKGITPPTQETVPTTPTNPASSTDSTETSTTPTKPNSGTDSTEASTTPTKPSNSQVGDEGFKDRFNGLLGELDDGTVRGKILAGALGNWVDSPIIGVGFGAALPGYEKDGEGIYEMEYVVRLYTTGLLGIGILFALMLYVGVAPLRKLRKDSKYAGYLAPCTVAYLGAVVATVSNPYIFSGFDYLFMLFLPVAFLNSVNTEKEIDEGEK